MAIMNERDFARFEFELCFGQMYHIAQGSYIPLNGARYGSVSIVFVMFVWFWLLAIKRCILHKYILSTHSCYFTMYPYIDWFGYMYCIHITKYVCTEYVWKFSLRCWRTLIVKYPDIIENFLNHKFPIQAVPSTQQCCLSTCYQTVPSGKYGKNRTDKRIR